MATRLGFAMAAAIMLASCGGETSASKSSTPENGGSEAAAAEPEAAPMTLAEKGRSEFRVCAVCHSVKDPRSDGYVSLIGPSLFNIYGAGAGDEAGFNYSPAMADADLTWDDATLDAYLAQPQALIPANRMAFAGIPNPEKRAAIIEYLKTLK